MFNLVYADAKGNIYRESGLLALGGEGREVWELTSEEMMPLPAGADLVVLSGCRPVGMDPETGELLTPEQHDGSPLWAVAALLPPGYTRLFLPVYEKEPERPPLGLFGYTAVAAKEGELYVAAYPLDPTEKWLPASIPRQILHRLVREKQEAFPHNRIIQQLARCTLEYRCLTARNIFLGKWEGGIPVSPQCNARCVGCISFQPAGCCPSPQARITFTPTVEEIVEVAVPHLEKGEEAIISFGQGCEGEPLLEASTIAEAIRRIRQVTRRGTININTNAGYTEGVRQVVEAGLDSMRVSLISARPEVYLRYHCPAGYTFNDVVASLRVAGTAGVYTSLNLLVMPGFTDQEAELEALVTLVRETGVKMIQLRNLNLDPEVLWEISPLPKELLGIREWLNRIKKELPEVRLGSYSLALK